MSTYNRNKRLNRVSISPDENPRVLTVNRYSGGRFVSSYYPIGKLKKDESQAPEQKFDDKSIVMTNPNKTVTATDAPIEFKKAPTPRDIKEKEEARKKKLAHKKLIASKIAKVLRGSGIQRM